MKKLLIAVAISLWIIIGIFNYGVTFFYFQNKYSEIAEESYCADMVFSIFAGIGGPFLLPTIAFTYFVDDGKMFYGFKWR